MKRLYALLFLMVTPALANPIAEANAAWEKAAQASKWSAINSCAAAKDGEAQRACYGAIERMAQGETIARLQPAPAPIQQQVVSTLPTTPGGWLAWGVAQIGEGIGGLIKRPDVLVQAYGFAENGKSNRRASQAQEVIASYARDQHGATMSAFQNTAIAGFNSNVQIAGQIQAPAPNITLSGTGVIGSGTYTGPVTRTCNGGTAAAGGNATGTTGTPTGGAGAPANGGNC